MLVKNFVLELRDGVDSEIEIGRACEYMLPETGLFHVMYVSLSLLSLSFRQTSLDSVLRCYRVHLIVHVRLDNQNITGIKTLG